jgi:SAM-dependent methyltransferase
MKQEEESASAAKQTAHSFSSKWHETSGYQIGGKDAFDAETLNWIVGRNGFETLDALGSYLGKHQRILDAGCGNGRILGLLRDVVPDTTELYGLDFAAAAVARENLADKVSGVFDADLTDSSTFTSVPRPDYIYCQEVLHHTSDPALSFRNLANHLLPGGELAIYVYRQKAPVREFTDDHVRRQIEKLNYEDAMEIAAEFSQLGRTLTELDIEFDVPRVRALGIPGGRYTVQRFLYHFFVKCYWNSELPVEHNNLINFDWYHPSLCSRHTMEEVLDWFKDNNLRVIHSLEDEYGITVRGKKAS